MKFCSMMLCLALCAACSSDNDEIEGPQPSKQSYPLTIEVTENPLVPDGDAVRSATKAVITTTSTLSQFSMNYVYGNNSTGSETATKNGEGKWTSEGSWPNDAAANGADVAWYASTAGTFQLNENNPYINFKVENQAMEQKDLLVATANGTWANTGGVLSFAFDHACSALRFYVKKATNLRDYTLTVSSIVLKNVVKQGEYYYQGRNWQLSNNRSDYTLFDGTKTLDSTTDYSLLVGSETDSYLFLIPQTLTAWDTSTAISLATTQCYLQIKCEISKDGNSQFSGTAYIPFGATFNAGYQHDVKINIGKNSLYSGLNTKIIN